MKGMKMTDYGKMTKLPPPSVDSWSPQYSKWDKLFYWILGIIFVAFLISVPFMMNDASKLDAQEWRDEGCKMYDNDLLKDVPAKCQTYFIDHYQAQPARLQPPETK